MTRIITKTGKIIPELKVSDLQRMSDLVQSDYEEKQARIVRQKDENRKAYWPKLWAEEQAAKLTK